jgi:hypothetical protein
MVRLQMNAKPIFLTAFLIFASLLNGLADDGISVQKASDGWKTNTYSQIGLKLQFPSSWKADVDDQGRRWSLLAYPLVENPVTDVQYRIVISVVKLPEEEHLRIYPKGTNSENWMISQHLRTGQMTNEFWIYTRRDIFGNGFGYFCSGRIKRDAHLKPKDVNRLDEDEEKLAIEVRQILDSIEILSTNSMTRP